VAGQECVRALPALAWISHPLERPGVLREQPLGCGSVRTRCWLVADRFERRRTAFRKDQVRGRTIDALHPQLLADGALTARSRAVPRLDPRPREGFVIEHPEVGETTDGRFHQARLIPGTTQPSTDFRHGS